MARLSPFAIEPQLEPDEDELEREDGDESEEGDLECEDVEDEEQEDSLTTIYHGLRRGSESAAQNAMAVAQILERMVHSASRGDIESLTRWHHTCQEIIAKVAEETGGE